MLRNNKEKQSIFTKKTQQMFLLFMLFAGLLSSASVLCYIMFFPDETAKITLKNAIKKNKERESIVKSFINNSELLLHTFGSSETFKEYQKNKTTTKELKRLLLTFSKSQKHYMQIRYIDKNGMEQIRIDRDFESGKSFVVPDDKLQDKSSRYYFKDSKQKELDKVWFSAIDLNMENSKVEIPYKPTFRAILPISKDGKFDGIIIVNYFMQEFLEKLLNVPLYNAILINDKGYPLINYKKDKSWGFYNKNRHTIKDQLPNYYQKIVSKDHFAYEKIASQRFDVPIKDGLIMILELKDEYIKKVNDREHFRYLMLFVITFLFSTLFSFIVVRKFSEVLSSLKDKNNELMRELYFDSLTKLKNRRSLMRDVESSEVTCLILIDIQSFNKVNDLYGGKAGDMLLQKFTDFLRENTKHCNSPSIYRLYGNTFALLNSVELKEHQLVGLIEKLIKNLEAYDFSFTYNGVVLDFVVDARIGFALALECDNIIESADMALNHAKKSNKDYVSYRKTLGIEQLYEKDIDTIKIIKKALAENRVVPYFQPIHKQGQIFYESLVRIVKEDGTVLTPYHFLDVAKRTKLYFLITRKMIEKTFEVFENTEYNFSINLSYLDIKNNETIYFIKRMLLKYNISNQLIIEIVESDTFSDYDSALKFLDAIREMGIKVAVDDFGSGYSNFSHLIKLNPDYIKIDGDLIKDMDVNDKSFRVIKAITSFGKDMNMEIIAEFIHSESVYKKAQTLNIDGYQGFLLGKPQSARDLFES